MTRLASSETLKSIAGVVAAGSGLLALRATLEQAAQLSKFRGGTPEEGFGLWHFVMLAASWNQHQVVQGLLAMFVTLWPLLAVVLGAGFLSDLFVENWKGR